MKYIPSLFVDFNNADQRGRVRLNTSETFASIKQANLELKEGMQVLLNDDSLTTIGYVSYSDEEKIWVADINWADIKHSNNTLEIVRNTEIEKQFAIYRQLLLSAKSIETDKSFIKQYDDHIDSLDKIVTAVNHNNIVSLRQLVEQESRYYGWSYLPNDYGEKVETAFWNLKKLVMDNN